MISRSRAVRHTSSLWMSALPSSLPELSRLTRRAVVPAR